MIPDVQHALNKPRNRHRSGRSATQRSPRSDDDEGEKQNPDIANEMFVVRAALFCDPAASEREVVEERPGCKCCLQTNWRHRDSDEKERDVLDPLMVHRTPLSVAKRAVGCPVNISEWVRDDTVELVRILVTRALALLVCPSMAIVNG